MRYINWLIDLLARWLLLYSVDWFIDWLTDWLVQRLTMWVADWLLDWPAWITCDLPERFQGDIRRNRREHDILQSRSSHIDFQHACNLSTIPVNDDLGNLRVLRCESLGGRHLCYGEYDLLTCKLGKRTNRSRNNECRNWSDIRKKNGGVEISSRLKRKGVFIPPRRLSTHSPHFMIHTRTIFIHSGKRQSGKADSLPGFRVGWRVTGRFPRTAERIDLCMINSRDQRRLLRWIIFSRYSYQTRLTSFIKTEVTEKLKDKNHFNAKLGLHKAATVFFKK